MKQSAVFRYPGGKYSLAKEIVSLAPEHHTYVEPFFGGGAVFFTKYPSKREAINDIDSIVINLFKVIRDNPDELAWLVETTPFAREEHECSYRTSLDAIEQARRTLVQSFQGIGGYMKYSTGFRVTTGSISTKPYDKWNKLPDIITVAAKRLKKAFIENVDAVQIIQRYDDEGTWIYVDPPYPKETRKNYLYKHESSYELHKRLLDACDSHKGKILISTYENKLYSERLLPPKWRRIELHSIAQKSQSRIETLFINYEIPTRLV